LRRDEEVVWELKAERILQYQGSVAIVKGKWLKSGAKSGKLKLINQK
jgi:hypothetical protein